MRLLPFALLLSCGSTPQGAPDAGCDGGNCGAACDGGSCSTTGSAPSISGCQIFPANHIFNTPIDALPVHPQSAAFLATIGSHHVHLDLGTDTNPASSTYYGIPWNVVHGNAFAWPAVHFYSADPGLSWDARAESDCASGADHQRSSPCSAASPVLPLPATPLVEGGIDTSPSQPYGDHHALLLDADTCRLWETYHTYPHSGGGGWDIYGSATWDLGSNALRPAGWTSCDAAGFPILPLLLRADEASSGEIRHALRFTIQSSKIRTSYVWPARHLTSNGTASASLPQMGQLFRLKASYPLPAGAGPQVTAILNALKLYGMYVADGGSDLFIQGEPSAAWAGATFTQVQAVPASAFEAVDISAITSRPGFDPDSAAVPPK